jgi:HEAT repeat protein
MLRRCLLFAVAIAATPALGDPPPPAEDAPGMCAVDWMIEAAREGFSTGSPAYRTYLRALLKEAAPTMALDALLDAVATERDPALLEALGAALASRASYEENPALLERLFDRAAADADPALRAAAVRALRATGSVETMTALGDAVTYESLVRDPSPDVRAAVADNLVAENRDVYGGRDARVADAAVKAAAASPDPALAGRVLAEISMEQAGADALATLTRSLSADAPALRQGAALALGSAPPGDGATRTALVERYQRDTDRGVRTAILQALARLGQSSAVPTLRSLRGIAPELDAEIDTWIDVLGLGLQEWHLILREKLKRTGGQPR